MTTFDPDELLAEIQRLRDELHKHRPVKQHNSAMRDQLRKTAQRYHTLCTIYTQETGDNP